MIINLMNRLMQEGIVPMKRKTSIINRIPKVSDKKKVEEYRLTKTLPIYEKNCKKSIDKVSR